MKRFMFALAVFTFLAVGSTQLAEAHGNCGRGYGGYRGPSYYGSRYVQPRYYSARPVYRSNYYSPYPVNTRYYGVGRYPSYYSSPVYSPYPGSMLRGGLYIGF